MERKRPEEKAKLSEKQEAFLEALFSEETGGDLRKSAREAGYSDETKLSDITGPIAEEIVRRAYDFLAAFSPEAIMGLLDVLRKPSQLGANNKLAAIKDILDRGGVVKTEKLEVDAPTNAVIILPKKDPIQDAPKEDNED